MLSLINRFSDLKVLHLSLILFQNTNRPLKVLANLSLVYILILETFCNKQKTEERTTNTYLYKLALFFFFKHKLALCFIKVI